MTSDALSNLGLTEDERRDAELRATLMVDQIVGYRVPRDADPARVIRCDANGRYLHRLTDHAGAVTVTRQHAMRFSSRTEAEAMRARLVERAGGRDATTTYTIVVLRPATPKRSKP